MKKKVKFTKLIYVSIYNPEEINYAIKKFKFDIIQLPINLFDRKLIDNGILSRLKKHGYEIHARSIFLQGLLLDSHRWKFAKWSEIFRFYKFCQIINLKNFRCLLTL